MLGIPGPVEELRCSNGNSTELSFYMSCSDTNLLGDLAQEIASF